MQTKVAEYALAMSAGDVFPPVTVFWDGEFYWLADGWHRVCAALCLGWQAIAAEVHEGGLREAEWHAFSVNATHGYPRGKDDVPRILRRIFEDPEWSAKPLREIARHTSIPPTTVRDHFNRWSTARPAQSGTKSSVREVTRSDGTTYEIETRNIGRSPAPEFLDNEATWHRPDAYRAPGEETAHPDYRKPIEGVHYPARDPKFWNISFPLEHREPAGMIRQMTRMLYEQLTLTPGQTVAALPWLVLPEFRTEASAVSDWLAQLVEALPYDNSLEEKLKK
jgi:hypothetical protein